MRAELLYESAADELKKKLPSLRKIDYSTIDNLMQRISKRYKITGKKLHDLFVSKYGHTPDTWIKKYKEKLGEEGVAEGTGALSVQQLATISDEALDNAYHYGRSTPGNTFGWQANLMSAAYAKRMIEAGVTDIEKISDAIHKGWNVTAQKFVQDPSQFDDSAKLQAAGKLEAKLQQRAQLMKQHYAQLPDEEQEKDRVVARALLQAIRGTQGMAEGSGPQVGDAVYYGKRLVGWFKGYSEHGKIITEPNYEEMGDEYANRDVYWDPQDKITIRPEQGVAEGRATYGPITANHKAASKKAFAAGERDGKAGAEKNKEYMSSALMKTTYLNGYKQGKQGVAEGSLEEVSQDTARSYAQKARASQKDLINQTHRKGADTDALNKKIKNRQQGMDRAHTDKRYYKDEQGVAEGSLEEYGDTKKGQKILTKVHKRAVGRAIKAADQGDAQAAKKNQDTANRAWERFGPSFGEGVAEGKESPEKEIERLKLRQDAEHGHAPLRRQAATQARIRELEKQIKGKQGVAEGEYDSRKPFGVRYKVFAGREGRMTTKEYWTTSEEKLQKAVDKIQALDNFYEIDGYSYPKESQGVTEVFADQGSGSTDRDNAEYMKRRKAAKFNKSAKPSKPKNQQEYDAIEKYRKDLAQTYNKPKKEQGVAEAKNLKKRVKIVKGPDAGKTGWIREIKHGAFKGALKSYYIDLDDGGQANNLPGAALRLIKDQSLSENAEDLHVGDPVIITGNGIKFEGATGEIVDFGRDNRFVVVNLYNHGPHSFHSSDVSFNEYAGSDDEEARMYDAGEFGDDYRDEMDEARTSAAQRLSNAWDRQRAKSNASLARTPSSIPKKEEPKKAAPVPKTVSEHRTQRRALMAQMLNSH